MWNCQLTFNDSLQYPVYHLLWQFLNDIFNTYGFTPIQDPKRVYTIAEYKNKQYRYTMSEYAVEIDKYFLLSHSPLNPGFPNSDVELPAHFQWLSIQMFARCENVEAAHKLSAHIFGIQHVRHFRVNCPELSHIILYFSFCQSNNSLLMPLPLPFFLILKLKYIFRHHQFPVLTFQRVAPLLFY